MGPRLSAAALVAVTFLAAAGFSLRQDGLLRLLPLGEVVARLPKVGAEWTGPDRRTLDPFSAELKRRLEEGAQLTDEQWRSALLDTGAVRARTAWPADETYALSLRKPAWLREFVLVLRPERGDLKLAGAQLGTFFRGSCGNPVIAAAERALYHRIGKLPRGTHVLPFRLELSQLPPGGNFASGLPVVVSHAELSLVVDVVPALDTVLPPVSSPELDRAVAESLYFFVSRGQFLGGSGSLEGRLQGLARSLRVEVFEGAELREAVTLFPTREGVFWPQIDTVRLTSISDAIVNSPTASARWSVRVYGSDEDVLHSWDCDRRWSGTLELTLDELIERGSRRPRWR